MAYLLRVSFFDREVAAWNWQNPKSIQNAIFSKSDDQTIAILSVTSSI